MSVLCTNSSLKRTKSRWRSQVGDASVIPATVATMASGTKTTVIKDIGKPTHFEHGIHVEYNRLTGKFMVRKDDMYLHLVLRAYYDDRNSMN